MVTKIYDANIMNDKGAVPEHERNQQEMNQEKIDWNNYGNQAFYQTIAADGLKELAEKGGLAAGCDLAQLRPYIAQKHNRS